MGISERQFLPTSDGCFICGEGNAAGLQTQFYIEDGRVKTRVQPRTHHCGYPGVIHGGIVAALLDVLPRNDISIVVYMHPPYLCPHGSCRQAGVLNVVMATPPPKGLLRSGHFTNPPRLGLRATQSALRLTKSAHMNIFRDEHGI